MLEAYPDRHGKVRNVLIEVVPKQEGVGPYKSLKCAELYRHVSKLIVLVPFEDQEDSVASSEDTNVVAASSK